MTDQSTDYSNSMLSTYSRVFKVVEAVICENKPASLPGLNASTWGENTGELRHQTDSFMWRQHTDGTDQQGK